MKWYMKHLASGFAVLALLGSMLSASAAQAVPESVQGNQWMGHLWVEDVRVGLLDSQGRPVTPLEYDGTVYIPLRNAGEWMGCAVAWDQNTQTVTLTSGGPPHILDAKDLPMRTEQEQATYGLRAEQGVTFQINPNVSILMDGKVQRFVNAAGTEVYPAALDGVTYLPVRSIGTLIGLEATWYKGPQVQDHMDGVQLHAPVTQAQRGEMQIYLDQCSAICSAFDTLADQLRADDAAQVQAAHADVKARLAELGQLPKPTASFFARYQKFIDAALYRANAMVAESGDPSGKYDALAFRLSIPQELSALQAEFPFAQGALDALPGKQ